MSSSPSWPPDRSLLPYLPPPPPIRLFGLQIPVFGLFLFVAALTAYLLITLRGRRLALGARVPEQLAGSLLLAAILGAHLTGTFADHGVAVFTTPAVLLSPSSTLSSAGGLAGAAAAGVLWVRRLRLDRRAALALADLAAYAFPFAWLVARAGCALVHDHPGRLSTSFLAVSFPGGARLDCGLLELLSTPLLIALALTLSRSHAPPPPGARSLPRAPSSPGAPSPSGQLSSAGAPSSPGAPSPSGELSSAGAPSSPGAPSPSGELSSAGAPSPTDAPSPNRSPSALLHPPAGPKQPVPSLPASLDPRPPGLLAASMAVAYSLLRFPLDFLRATDLPTSDPRYLGLTAAQWGALPLFAAGAWCLVLATKNNHPPGPRDRSSPRTAAVPPSRRQHGS